MPAASARKSLSVLFATGAAADAFVIGDSPCCAGREPRRRPVAGRRDRSAGRPRRRAAGLHRRDPARAAWPPISWPRRSAASMPAPAPRRRACIENAVPLRRPVRLRRWSPRRSTRKRSPRPASPTRDTPKCCRHWPRRPAPRRRCACARQRRAARGGGDDPPGAAPGDRGRHFRRGPRDSAHRACARARVGHAAAADRRRRPQPARRRRRPVRRRGAAIIAPAVAAARAEAST